MRVSRKIRERRRRQKRMMFTIWGLLSLTLFSLIGFYIYTFHPEVVTDLFSKNKQTIKTAIQSQNKKTEVEEMDKSNNEMPQTKETDNEENDVNAKSVTPIKEGEEIEIVFAGDTMFDWDLRPILEKNGYDEAGTKLQ